jgi:TatD DNase family protein
MMTPGWIDVHTHLNFLKNTTPEAALQQALDSGVSRLITIGTEPNDHSVVLELARRHFPEVSCTLGVHPHEGAVYDDEVETWLVENLHHREVVAVGEIGLDYYYQHSPRDRQQEAFRRQLELAVRSGLPVEIHTRDAEADTVEILKEFRGRVTGIIHCFTGTQWLAREALDLGFDISLSGVVTFKNAEELRSVARYVPLDRLHVETDAPFLAPVPHRGQPNLPVFVVATGRFVADLKGVSEEALRDAAWRNARRIFPRMQL